MLSPGQKSKMLPGVTYITPDPQNHLQSKSSHLHLELRRVPSLRESGKTLDVPWSRKECPCLTILPNDRTSHRKFGEFQVLILDSSEDYQFLPDLY